MTGFPISETSPTTHNAALPEAADCVVIGGGVMGVMTAYWLARAGVSVALVEKGRVAGEQSGRNWGWVRAQGRDPDELPIMIEAAQHWRMLAQQVDCDIGLRQGGVMYLADTQQDLAGYQRWLDLVPGAGLDTKILGRDGVARALPGAVGDWAGAIYTASDMRAEPWLAVPALARLAVSEGVVIREACAARALDLEAGLVAGVMTEAGRIKTSNVVVAGGAWSRLFLGAHGVAIPQLSVRASVCATEQLPDVSQIAVAGGNTAFRRRADGGYSVAASGFHELFIGRDAFRSLPKFWAQLKSDPFGTRFYPMAPNDYPDAWGTTRRWSGDEISPFERQRVLNPKPHTGKLRAACDAMAAIYPGLGPVRPRVSWAGMIDTMPDLVPVIDHADAVPGLVVATGLSGHGFGIGPGFGRVVADLVQGRDPGHDLTRFRLSRFGDGSAMDLGPAL